MDLAVGLQFPGAPDNPACGHRTVRCATRQSGVPPDSPVLHAQTVRSSTLGLFFDLFNVFF
jgi:hypothetical protein